MRPLKADRWSLDSLKEMYSDRFEQALAFAHRLHRKQRRKTSGAPYIGHLLGVAAIVIEDDGTEDEAIAALLHDSLEDQGGTTKAESMRWRRRSKPGSESMCAGSSRR